MIHGVVLKGMVINRLVLAVASKLSAKGLLPCRAHAYCEAFVKSKFWRPRWWFTRPAIR